MTLKGLTFPKDLGQMKPDDFRLLKSGRMRQDMVQRSRIGGIEAIALSGGSILHKQTFRRELATDVPEAFELVARPVLRGPLLVDRYAVAVDELFEVAVDEARRRRAGDMAQ